MTAKIIGRYKSDIGSFKLIPSRGGCFELTIDGNLIYSKLAVGTFPDEAWAVDAVGERIKTA